MSKLITLTFLIVGLAVGFLGALSVASKLRPNQTADATVLVLVFCASIVAAVLFRLGAALARDRTPPRYWPLLGSVGAALAFASVAVLFSSIK